jgi:hypothetical protein
VFHPEPGRPITLIPETHGRIRPKGEDISLPDIIRSREERPHDSGLQEGSHCIAFCNDPIHLDFPHHTVFAGTGVKADGRAVREVKEPAEFRHGDEIFFLRDDGSRSGKTNHPEIRVIIDSTLTIGVKHVGKVDGVFGAIHMNAPVIGLQSRLTVHPRNVLTHGDFRHKITCFFAHPDPGGIKSIYGIS